MSKATEFLKKIYEFLKGPDGKAVKTGEQDDGSFIDPAYVPIPVRCEDIIAQATNPNYQTSKSFQALQQSIWNNGMSFPVLISENPLYDPSTEGMPKPKCFSGGQDTVDVRDPELRKYYKYTVVDGTHRLLAVLYGSDMYEKSEFNKNSRKIYERCGGIIPCVMLEGKTEQEMMSATILFNSARGEHSLTEMKDIVADLSRSGMSDQWISKNLFLDPEAITRFKQLSGMKAAFNDENYKEDGWDPVRDGVVERRKNINLTLAARRYVRKYRALRGFANTVASDEAIDIIMAAKNLGWDPENPGEMPKTLDKNGNVFEKEYENDEDAVEAAE